MHSSHWPRPLQRAHVASHGLQLPSSREPNWPIGHSAEQMKGAGWLYGLKGQAEPAMHALHMASSLGATQLPHVGWHLPTQ